MRKIVVLMLLILGSVSGAYAYDFGYGTGSNPGNHYVNPYVTNYGTYMPGHYQTNPNRTDLDNYGTRGNFNPNTGSFGTRSPRRW